MVQVAILDRTVIDHTDYGSTEKIVNSISEWDEVTEEECRLLENYFGSFYSRKEHQNYCILKRLDYAENKEIIFNGVRDALEKIKKEEEKQRKEQEKYRQKSEATALLRKKKRLEKLKQELGEV